MPFPTNLVNNIFEYHLVITNPAASAVAVDMFGARAKIINIPAGGTHIEDFEADVWMLNLNAPGEIITQP